MLSEITKVDVDIKIKEEEKVLPIIKKQDSTPVKSIAKKRINVPTVEDSLIKYAIDSKVNCFEVKKYLEKV